MARTVGWIAHASEQLQHGGLIRPRARYIGPAPGRSRGSVQGLSDIHEPCMPKSYRKSLRIFSAVGSIMPPPCRRRIVQIASPTINAAPITASIQ